MQEFVTKEFLKNVEPYVPFDVAGKYENPGRLIESGHIEDGTDVVWRTPYARKHYYHPEQQFQGEPQRGAYWAARYMQEGGQEELEKGAREKVRRISGK